MKKGQLSDYFDGVAVKKLSAVETSPAVSNQHEFNGSMVLRALLGDADRRNIPARFIWLEQEQQAISVDASISWYDARRKDPKRTEYRLYYPGNEITRMMREGDVLFLAMRKDGSALVIFTPADGTILNQLLWLFGLERQPELQFQIQEVEGRKDAELDFAARYILDEIGIEPEEPEVDRLDSLIEPFGLEFPSTRIFSDLARSSLPEVSASDDPDAALVKWIEREEQLFRRLERRIVAGRIETGFSSANGADVDGFLSFSLSVQNRRKSRAGAALENHLEKIFSENRIRFARGVVTENKNKPDFLFPGIEEYRNPAYPEARLTILGAKSTLKDRWRQVLSEAERVPKKHLITLEPGISENQTNEMRAKSLQLVVPSGIHTTFSASQRGWLMKVSEFLELVRERQ
ncbi:type II restriction endonuclease [Parvibaculum sp.]|uniref:type II restriction endonuclease n=1 Tax=Parvibaculum sp. TaxID=2024848 RepID=UPI00391C750C